MDYIHKINHYDLTFEFLDGELIYPSTPPFNTSSEFRNREKVLKKLLRNYLKCLVIEEYNLDMRPNFEIINDKKDKECRVKLTLSINQIHKLTDIPQLITSFTYFSTQNNFRPINYDIKASVGDPYEHFND